jgi:hypothetical protein
MGNLLDKASLLTKEKLEIKKVEFENGDYVYVRQMTGREKDIFEQSLVKKNKNDKGLVVSFEQSTEDFRAKLAVVTLCDADGKSLLEPKDYATLSLNMSAKRLEIIVNEAQKLNAISEEDKEVLVKNSVAVQDGSSNSDSVEN